MKRNSKPLTQDEINEKMLYTSKSPYWIKAKQYGDVTSIAEQLGMSKVYISRAINKGLASLPVLRFVDEYYRKREEQIRSKRTT